MHVSIHTHAYLMLKCREKCARLQNYLRTGMLLSIHDSKCQVPVYCGQ